MRTSNGQKLEVGIQMPESKIAAETNSMSGPLVPVGEGSKPGKLVRKWAAVHVILRLLSIFSSVMALCFMVTAEQSGTLSIYGFNIPLYSKWSFSDSLEYLVVISAAVATHSLLQLLLAGWKLIKKSPLIPSRKHAWMLFVGDQAFAYAMMSAGSAAAGVTNLNRTGIRHANLPNFCKPLRSFCDHAAVSITFAFFTCLLLATSAVTDVLWLSSTSSY